MWLSPVFIVDRSMRGDSPKGQSSKFHAPIKKLTPRASAPREREFFCAACDIKSIASGKSITYTFATLCNASDAHPHDQKTYTLRGCPSSETPRGIHQAF
jgi:hypothetical protein